VRRPDLMTLIHHAAARGLRVGLSPSATPELVRQDFRAWKDAGVARISLSVDGATQESHDLFRGVPGTWALTMQALAKAAAAGLALQINTTFTRQNLGEFHAFADLIANLQPVLWSVFQLVPTARGKRDDLLTADEMEDLFRRLYRLSLTAPFDIKTTEGHHYRRVVQQQAQGRSLPVRRASPGVNAGKGFVFISHTGDIQPSGFLPLTAGNVRREELGDVYCHSGLFCGLRNPNLLRGKCGGCEFRSICGGSGARAYAMSGDYLGEEPLCVYQPPRRSRREEAQNTSTQATGVPDNQALLMPTAA
jgi:radical SAM protein with 4Fe4S-binding SPASM domain